MKRPKPSLFNEFYAEKMLLLFVVCHVYLCSCSTALSIHPTGLVSTLALISGVLSHQAGAYPQ